MTDKTPTILLLPGLLCDGSIWEIQRAALGAIAPTLVADFTTQDDITAMAHSVLAMADGPLIVIGHSMGGRVAMEVARLAGARLVGLALLDTGMGPRRPGEDGKRQALVDVAKAGGMGALADAWLPPMVKASRLDDAPLMQMMREMVLRMSPEIHGRQITALLNRPDARKYLGLIKCPTLVLVGRNDQWSPPAQHEEIAALMPNAHLTIIEDCGHMSLCEKPVETTQVLLAFVKAIKS